MNQPILYGRVIEMRYRKLLSKFVSVFLVALLLESGFLWPPVSNVQAATEGDYEYFEIVDDNTVRISRYTGTDTEVIIPDQLGGMDVVEISGSAFRVETETSPVLTSVTIPNTVKRIGYAAFANNQLTELHLPDSVTEIGERAFAENALTSVNLPDSVMEIGDYAFMYNKLTSVSLPNTLTTISMGAFQNNEIETLTIPDSVTTIAWNAFYDKT